MTDYFAGANGRCGFINYFPAVFNNAAFERIIIIKGGPGTGKSTFMRQAADRFAPYCKIERFLCGSDPSSLDGVIIEGGSRVGILDGTSPHARECTLPGACEVIFDAGCCWNTGELSGKRGVIEKLNRSKSQCFAKAYHYLSCVGAANELAFEEIRAAIKKTAVDEAVGAAMCAIVPSGDYRCEPRLLSAISMSGFASLDTFAQSADATHYIRGSKYAAAEFLHRLHKRLESDGVSHYYSPSALDSGIIEGIFIKGANEAYVLSGDSSVECSIDADTFIDSGMYAPSSAKIKNIERVAGDFTGFALGYLGEARKYHAALEEIYVEAMDFDRLGKMKAETLDDIAAILR